VGAKSGYGWNLLAAARAWLGGLRRRRGQLLGAGLFDRLFVLLDLVIQCADPLADRDQLRVADFASSIDNEGCLS
jgi:hypothetical protein